MAKPSPQPHSTRRTTPPSPPTPAASTGAAETPPAPGTAPEDGSAPSGGATPDGGNTPDDGSAPAGGASPEGDSTPAANTTPDDGSAPQGGTTPEDGTPPDAVSTPPAGDDEAPEGEPAAWAVHPRAKRFITLFLQQFVTTSRPAVFDEEDITEAIACLSAGRAVYVLDVPTSEESDARAVALVFPPGVTWRPSPRPKVPDLPANLQGSIAFLAVLNDEVQNAGHIAPRG